MLNKKSVDDINVKGICGASLIIFFNSYCISVNSNLLISCCHSRPREKGPVQIRPDPSLESIPLHLLKIKRSVIYQSV